MESNICLITLGGVKTMNLQMRIKNIKSIQDLTFTFPLEKGLYAIAGENASGKSTVVSCASTVFFNMPMKTYFGRQQEGASIEFELNGATRSWRYKGGVWMQFASQPRMAINGFYEGSVIFGNRFRDTNMKAIDILDAVEEKEIEPADAFVKEHLGIILHDDKDYYDSLYVMKNHATRKKQLSGYPYFYTTKNGIRVSQARMSTGENLLISILHSLMLVRKKRKKNTNDGRPCIVFLDEIELALHASALRRLVFFLKEISAKYDLSIFFSTHSLELIRDIKPQNIFYLTRLPDDKIIITNPCYPAFATRNLYSDDGYGNDVVILVEDDLSKMALEYVLVSEQLLSNIRVKILPTGGWTNTIIMARDLVALRLLLKGTCILTVLDKDIKPDVPNFLRSHKECSDVKIDYLPVPSLEKYLKKMLVDELQEDFFQKLNSYLFQGKPLEGILHDYNKQVTKTGKPDTDGKVLYGLLIDSLRSIRKDRDDLIEVVMDYVKQNESEELEQLKNYLSKAIKGNKK